MPTTAPVVFLMYNRPETTERVFEAISEEEPEKLYVIAGGPKDEEDEKQVQKARDIINIDWDCDFRKKYYEENHGIFKGIYKGLEYVFDREERAIILEDDTVPSESFFSYCEQLLDWYENDERVMSISGHNRQTKWKEDQADYHFSYYPQIWGWATWRDAWEKYDPNMELWGSDFIQERVQDCIGLTNKEFHGRKSRYDAVYYDDFETWDYQWSFAHNINSGLSIFPSKNLVKNIGVGEDATHTTGKDYIKPTFKYDSKLSKTDHVTVDREYDKLVNTAKTSHSLKQTLTSGIRRVFDLI